jgi:uncharacterized protein (TIGR02452 family)
MMKRNTRALLAKQTLEILEKGFYQNEAGEKIEIGDWQRFAETHSVHYKPDSFDEIFRLRDEILQRSSGKITTSFEVENETTLHAAKRLLAQGFEQVLCLNFASAKNPGGGFLNGSQAQEESLARATGIYPCIATFREMYDTNIGFDSCLYTDHMIYSPSVSVFRNDRDDLLAKPYLASFITAPAVNISGMLNRREAIVPETLAQTMLSRIEKILSIAVIQGHRTLVLGAWGCGVFKNDPDHVAAYFYNQLVENPTFLHAFDKVVFAVLDNTGDESTIRPFKEVFVNK